MKRAAGSSRIARGAGPSAVQASSGGDAAPAVERRARRRESGAAISTATDARGSAASARHDQLAANRATTTAAGANGAGRTAAAALHVRPALVGDLAPLEFFFDTLLRRDYFLRRGQLREMLAGAHHRAWVAEIDSVLVGVAVVTAGCRLVNVLVHPGYRGLGIGRALVSATGASEVRVKTDMASGDPRDFYRALGFESTGEFNAKQNIEVMRAAQTPPLRAGKEKNERTVKP